MYLEERISVYLVQVYHRVSKAQVYSFISLQSAKPQIYLFHLQRVYLTLYNKVYQYYYYWQANEFFPYKSYITSSSYISSMHCASAEGHTYMYQQFCTQRLFSLETLVCHRHALPPACNIYTSQAHSLLHATTILCMCEARLPLHRDAYASALLYSNISLLFVALTIRYTCMLGHAHSNIMIVLYTRGRSSPIES